MISLQLASAVFAEHREYFDDNEVKWVNYPFTRTYEIGIGYGGQANFSNIFELANNVKLWAATNGYVIGTVNKTDYKYDDPESYDDFTVETAFSFTVTKLGDKFCYTGETLSETDNRLANYEVEVAAIMAAGDYILQELNKDN